MKIERLRDGIEVLNKLNGKKYKVISVDGCGTAQEMLPDGTLGDDTVMITEKNCLAFRIISDPAPYPIPDGYTIVNGLLYKNGEPVCEQGRIVLKDILACQPGFLILTAECEDDEKHVNLLSYQIARDMFIKLYQNIPAPKLLGYTDKEKNTAYIGYSEVDEYEEKNKDGEVSIVRAFKGAVLFCINKGKEAYDIIFDRPIVLDEVVFVNAENESGIHLFVPTDEEVSDDDELIKGDRMWYSVSERDYEFLCYMEGNISASWSPLYHEYVVKNEDSLRIPSRGFYAKSPEIKKLYGFDILIDITKEDYAYKLTFSNEQFEFKTLTSRSTRDRGYIVTVE